MRARSASAWKGGHAWSVRQFDVAKATKPPPRQIMGSSMAAARKRWLPVALLCACMASLGQAAILPDRPRGESRRQLPARRFGRAWHLAEPGAGRRGDSHLATATDRAGARCLYARGRRTADRSARAGPAHLRDARRVAQCGNAPLRLHDREHGPAGPRSQRGAVGCRARARGRALFPQAFPRSASRHSPQVRDGHGRGLRAPLYDWRQQRVDA